MNASEAGGDHALIQTFLLFSCNACINVKPEGGGGDPWAYVGHLTSIAFLVLGNLTKNLGPRVGTFAFFARRTRTKSHRLMCSSVRRRCFPFRKRSMSLLVTKPFRMDDAISSLV